MTLELIIVRIRNIGAIVQENMIMTHPLYMETLLHKKHQIAENINKIVLETYDKLAPMQKGKN